MNLDDYLKTPGALTVTALRQAIGAKSDAQIRQWRVVDRETTRADMRRRPSAAYCMPIEVATSGAVMRWDLRPNDWYLIWPDLRMRRDAPPIVEQVAA